MKPFHVLSVLFTENRPLNKTDMREWLRGGASPCQGEGRGFESRLALFFMAFKPSVYAGLEVFDSGNQPDETSDAERPAPLSGSEPFPKAEGCGSVDGRISIRIVFT